VVCHSQCISSIPNNCCLPEGMLALIQSDAAETPAAKRPRLRSSATPKPNSASSMKTSKAGRKKKAKPASKKPLATKKKTLLSQISKSLSGDLGHEETESVQPDSNGMEITSTGAGMEDEDPIGLVSTELEDGGSQDLSNGGADTASSKAIVSSSRSGFSSPTASEGFRSPPPVAVKIERLVQNIYYSNFDSSKVVKMEKVTHPRWVGSCVCVCVCVCACVCVRVCMNNRGVGECGDRGRGQFLSVGKGVGKESQVRWWIFKTTPATRFKLADVFFFSFVCSLHIVCLSSYRCCSRRSGILAEGWLGLTHMILSYYDRNPRGVTRKPINQFILNKPGVAFVVVTSITKMQLPMVPSSAIINAFGLEVYSSSGSDVLVWVAPNLQSKIEWVEELQRVLGQHSSPACGRAPKEEKELKRKSGDFPLMIEGPKGKGSASKGGRRSLKEVKIVPLFTPPSKKTKENGKEATASAGIQSSAERLVPVRTRLTPIPHNLDTSLDLSIRSSMLNTSSDSSYV